MSDAVRILRVRQVGERTGLSRSTIYELVAEGLMPPPVRVGHRTVGWIESEVEEFLRQRIAQSRTPASRGAACA